MDTHSKAQRSFNMSRIRSRDTVPEMIVRRLLFSMGYRYRVNSKDLPGKPDIVFTRKRKVIFVHGCFWHRCPTCNLSLPKSNVDYWSQKFQKNVERDRRKAEALAELGWSVHTIWECEIEDGASSLLRILTI